MSFRTGHAFKSSSSYSPLQFTFSEIKLATKNFDESLVIGRGGFGKVYRGTVTCGGNALLDVAIKRLDSDSSQGAGEFWAEVEMLSKLRHCHLVSVDEEHWGLATWAQDSIKEGRLKQIVDPELREIISPKCLKEFALLADRCLHSRPKQRPTMAEVVVGLESILALHERPDNTLFMKFFRTKVPTSMSPPNPESSGDGPQMLGQEEPKCIITPKLITRQFFIDGSSLLYVDGLNDGLSNVGLTQPNYTLSFPPAEKEFQSRLLLGKAQSNKRKGEIGGTSLESLDIYLYTVGGEHRIVRRFDFNTILDATQNFSNAYQNMLGDVPMYKGRLQNGQDITIAEYSNATEYKECMNEASFLVSLNHENVIQLLGYCIERTKVYLLYDLAFNATLAGLIYDLDWNKRYKIILGVARVLVYLHNHAPIRILHGDVNPRNILLDESFNPKLSDFRSARIINETDCIYVDYITPTMGYIAPEYFSKLEMSTKADVFSFGVLVLETVTGQSIIDLTVKGKRLIDYVRRNWLEGTLSNITDADADANLMTKTVEIGLLCVQTDPVNRPTMKEVFDMLSGTLSPTISVSEMRARMTNVTVSYTDWCVDPETDYDTSAADAFVSELCPR
ncbi:hypothetical protein E3N88_05661 [Mikania micrantha]|uniref:Protein kinase domain-containing protein n=1 Tax=Mikania micrantha TaxID=192012 RepID=A0A5N6PNF4_9ASTR|nr:hypothetical protein E3N88_05661 [Mikania micrantha]